MGDRLDTICDYNAEEPCPSIGCVQHLRGLGYDNVRDADDCRSYFQGKFLMAPGEEEKYEFKPEPVSSVFAMFEQASEVRQEKKRRRR